MAIFAALDGVLTFDGIGRYSGRADAGRSARASCSGPPPVVFRHRRSVLTWLEHARRQSSGSGQCSELTTKTRTFAGPLGSTTPFPLISNQTTSVASFERRAGAGRTVQARASNPPPVDEIGWRGLGSALCGCCDVNVALGVNTWGGRLVCASVVRL